MTQAIIPWIKSHILTMYGISSQMMRSKIQSTYLSAHQLFILTLLTSSYKSM